MEELVGQLADSETGIGFVYEALERVVSALQVVDAIVVVDEPATGAQAFRSGRRPIEGRWALGIVGNGEAGLYTDPPVGQGGDDLTASMTAVADLCAVALRVDLLRHDATHDPLTGLLNRRSFDLQLARAVSHSRRHGWRFALVLLDIDNFKDVNDRRGHQAGDEVLQTIGVELRLVLRAGDTGARLGGDEFGLLLADPGDDLSPMLARLEASISTGVSSPVTFSTGMACLPEEGVEAAALYELADHRLYESKRR